MAGDPPDVLRQPRLAELLHLLARDGPSSVYGRPAATREPQGLADAGAPLLSADFYDNLDCRKVERSLGEEALATLRALGD